MCAGLPSSDNIAPMFDPYTNKSSNAGVVIVPAVLPHSFKDLTEHVEKLKGAALKFIQIDAVDGVFAHNRTWPYRDTSTFEKVAKEEHGLPLWEEFDFEFDLMVEDPFEKLMDFVHAGAARMLVHAKSKSALHSVQKLVDLREETGALPLEVGVAIGCDEQPDALEPFEAQFDYVQVMGIEKVGYQGEPFDKRAVYMLERLRQRYPTLALQVDGGVSLENCRMLAQAGANRLVVGSAIFNQDDPLAAIAALTAEANK